MSDLSGGVALHGSFHNDNYGDILLLLIFHRWIREALPDDNIRIHLPFASPQALHSAGLSGGGGIRDLLHSSVLVYGGGGYFGETSRLHPMRWGYRALLKHTPPGYLMQLQHKRYGILGVGAGPITNRLTRRAVCHLCEHATVLAVRDEESRDYLADYGVDASRIAVVADAALAITEADIPPQTLQTTRELVNELPGEVKIGLHLDFPGSFASQWPSFAGEILKFAQAHPEVYFVGLIDKTPTREHLDRVEALIHALDGHARIIPNEQLWHFTSLIGALDIILTTKLHVGIVGSAFHRQVLSFPYHDKTKRFYKQAGLSERCIPLAELQPGQVKSQLEMALRNRGETVELPATLIQDALHSKMLLSQLLAM